MPRSGHHRLGKRGKSYYASDAQRQDSAFTHAEDVQKRQEGEERLLRDDQRREVEGSAQVSDEESKSPPVDEVQDAPKIRDRFDKQTEVRADHPSIRSFIKNMAKEGRTKEEAIKLSGASYEIVDKYYQEHKKERD